MAQPNTAPVSSVISNFAMCTATCILYMDYSAGGGGRMTTLKMAHMHYVACGPTCNIMHVGLFSGWSFDLHLDVQLLNRYVTYGRNVELTDDR